jgi:hypothetical protein
MAKKNDIENQLRLANDELGFLRLKVTELKEANSALVDENITLVAALRSTRYAFSFFMKEMIFAISKGDKYENASYIRNPITGR